MAFIYKIERVGTDQCYVGHTSMTAPDRWKAHRYHLNLGDHHSSYLQRAWSKDGAAAFVFEIIEECPDEDKVVREQYFMDTLNSCFNGRPAADSNLGLKYSDEARARMSLAQQANERAGKHRLGFKETPEQTASRVALLKIGMEASPHIWITDGISNKRHPLSEPVDIGWHQGRTFSEEHKAATLAASSGPRSDETRANIKAGHAATWSDPAKRAAMLAGRRPFGWYTNGAESKRVADDETPPAGWWKGRGTQPAQPKVAQGPQMWITNGTETRKVDKGSEIPDGWRQGRTFSEDHKAAIAATGTTFSNEAHRAKAQEALDLVTAAKDPQVWITDGVVNRKVDVVAPNVPDGWSFGHTLSAEGRATISKAAKAMMSGPAKEGR